MKFFLLFLSIFPIFVFTEEIQIEVPLYINERLLEDIPVIIDIDTGFIKLKIEPLKYVMEEYLTKEGMDDLDEFINSLDYFKENSYTGDKNIKLFFSTVDQSLHIDLRLNLLRTKFTDVRRPAFSSRKDIGKKITPDPFSGYVNVEAGIKNRKNYNIAFIPRGLSTFGNVDVNLHFKDTIFKGNGYFLAGNTLGVNPVNAVLTKRFPESGLNWSLGTINAHGISFQGTSPILGINFNKDSDLITDATIGSMSRHDIFLNAPSFVKVKMNGIEINRLDLPAGSHTLQNFPLSQGLNNVTLEITGPTGEKREVDISMFYNASLMRVADTEANLSVGFPSYKLSRGAAGFYDFGQTVAVSGYLKGGILDSFTLGGYLQLFDTQFFSGLQGVFVKPYFKTIGEAGFSWKASGAPYFKTRLAILQPDAWDLPLSWNFVVEAAQKGFRYFGGNNSDENLFYQASGSLGTSTYRSIALNMVGQYGNFRDVGNKYSVQGTLSVTPKNWLSIRGMVTWNKILDRPGKVQTAFTFDLTPRYNDFATKTSYNTRQKALTSAVTFNRALPGRRSVNGMVGFNNAPGADQLEGNVHYNGSHTSLRISQQLMKNSSLLVNSTVAVLGASIGSALVFSGTKVAISRPLRDSFVIVSPNKYLRKTPVLINPERSGYAARASYLKPVVIPMTSYSNMFISLAQENGGYGGSYEDTLFNVQSLNKSGCVLEIGSPPTYIIEGTLLDGIEVVEGMTGMLISTSKIDGKTYKFKFFTDTEGTFQILGVVPGKYIMRFTNENYLSIDDIEIEAIDEDLNYIHLGEFNLKMKHVERIYKELRDEN